MGDREKCQKTILEIERNIETHNIEEVMISNVEDFKRTLNK